MSELRLPLRDSLQDPVDREGQLKICQAVLLRRKSRGGERSTSLVRAVVPAFAVSVVLVVVAVTMLVRPEREPNRPGALMVIGEGALDAIAVPSDHPRSRHLRLDDGSAIDIKPGAAIETAANRGDLLDVRLLRGAAFFDVNPGGTRRWVVDAGLARVEVIGTAFMLERARETLVVAVERGSVVVRSEALDDGQRRLVMGESLVVRRSEPACTVAASGPEPAGTDAAFGSEGGDLPSEAEVAGDVPIERSAPSATLEREPRRPSRVDWRELARQGEYYQAYDLLGAGGISRETGRVETMAELLSLADIARLSGHPVEAVAPLERGLATFPNDRRAPVAAFTIGRLQLDVLGNPRRAAVAFRRCIDLGAPHALQADAFARLAQAYARAGDRPGAREAAEAYLRRFPDGRRAAEMRRLLEPSQ